MSKNHPSLLQKLQSYWRSFRKLPAPEKTWVLRHPFSAMRIPAIKNLVEQIIRQKYQRNEWDASYSDGQLDALRHALWMALTARQIGVEKARSLGKAHEAGNKIMAQKKQKEHGSLADKASTDMDLRNNEVGLRMAQENPDASVEQLVTSIENQIKEGRLWIIKQDARGRYLSWEGHKLNEKDYRGKWLSPRCIVPSNYNLDEKPNEHL